MAEKTVDAKAGVEPFVFPVKEAQSEHYELMLLVSGNASDEDAAKTYAEVKDLITGFQGEITLEDVMGRTSIAYSIDKSRMASYFVVEFDMLKNELAHLQEKLRIRKDVTRYLIIKKRKRTPDEIAAEDRFKAKREEYRKKKMIANATKKHDGPFEKRSKPVEKKESAPAPAAETVDKGIDKLLDENVAV